MPDGTSLERLLAGNDRFARGEATARGRDGVRRVETADDQQPFAVVVGCSDSRVPLEIVFDEGIGDLFVVRVAGNIASAEVLGSIEFAVEVLGAKLVVVMGHENCGAVRAAVDHVRHGAETPGHIGSLVEPIVPAVRSLADLSDEEIVDAAVRENVRRQAHLIASSKPLLKPLVDGGRLAVVGAHYHLHTGRTEIIG